MSEHSASETFRSSYGYFLHFRQCHQTSILASILCNCPLMASTECWRRVPLVSLKLTSSSVSLRCHPKALLISSASVVDFLDTCVPHSDTDNGFGHRRNRPSSRVIQDTGWFDRAVVLDSTPSQLMSARKSLSHTEQGVGERLIALEAAKRAGRRDVYKVDH
jgi:hypothetical protein